MNATAPSSAIGRFEDRLWPADPSAYGRKARRGGSYRPFIPAPISERSFEFNGAAVAAISYGSRDLAHLSSRPPQVETLGAIARNLLRSESVASSRIEGIRISHKRLARAAFGSGKGGDNRAAEVLGNVAAMERAIEIGATANPFTVEDVLDIHRRLLQHTADKEIAGVVRESQNWIGGNDYNPVGAVYVPPPHEHVPELLEDLALFMARDDLAPLAQAALAHAQFENIHPFADGNGRTGRALIYSILRRRGEIQAYVPPISLVLASEPKNYVKGLGAYSQGKVSTWTEMFSASAGQAAQEAGRLADTIEQRQREWLVQLGEPRKDSAVRQLISALPAQPVIDVATGEQITGKSHVAIGNALKQLERAGILKRLNERRWGRTWECDDLLDLVGEFEKSISAP